MTDIYGKSVEFQGSWVLLRHNDESENGIGAWDYLSTFYEANDAEATASILRKDNPERIYVVARFLS
jgi:hypothetical protein